MSRIKFQQEHNEDLQMPWSVIVDEDRSIIYGRPDARYLMGFTPKGEQNITVLGEDAIATPNLAIGLAPVFTGYDGKMFVIDLAVKDCVVYDGDDATVAHLREREAQMREAGGW